MVTFVAWVMDGITFSLSQERQIQIDLALLLSLTAGLQVIHWMPQKPETGGARGLLHRHHCNPSASSVIRCLSSVRSVKAGALAPVCSQHLTAPGRRWSHDIFVVCTNTGPPYPWGMPPKTPSQC